MGRKGSVRFTNAIGLRADLHVLNFAARLQEFYESLLQCFWNEPPKGFRGPNTEELRSAEKEGLLQAFQFVSTTKCTLSAALVQVVVSSTPIARVKYT